MTTSWMLWIVLSASDPKCAKLLHEMEAYQEINRQFPDMLSIEGNECHLVESCPDETCDAFVARRSGPPAKLIEFAYLYLYYFSTYHHDLKEWRGNEKARSLAIRLLRAAEFKPCWQSNDREAARCVLRLLAKERAIDLFFVRYDEGARNAVAKKIP